MNGSGKAEMRQVSLAALPSISTTSLSGSSTRGGPFSRSSFRDLSESERAVRARDPPPPTRTLNVGVGGSPSGAAV
uniref:Uncharacterized protein n=1 Tax=Canis lupus familiaris TaxID=9615 RepID=A0A8C0QH79_CANLF